MSKGIHEELEIQNKMLGALESDVEMGQSNLDIVTSKVHDLVKKSGGPRYFCIIIVLSIILIILIFLFIYT